MASCYARKNTSQTPAHSLLVAVLAIRGRGGSAINQEESRGQISCRSALTHVRPIFTLMTDVKLDPGFPASAERSMQTADGWMDRSIDRSISDRDTDNTQKIKKGGKKEKQHKADLYTRQGPGDSIQAIAWQDRPLPRRVKPPQIVPLYASNVFHPIPRSISDSRRVSISMPQLCAYLLSRLRPSWYSTGSSCRAARRVRSFPWSLWISTFSKCVVPDWTDRYERFK